MSSGKQMKSPRITLSFALILTTACGCASTARKSPAFDNHISHTKVIAVMPADIQVYQLTAGGVRELMDEWSDAARKLMQETLRKHLAGRYGFEIKFVEEDWLRQNHKDLWERNRGLYGAVADSALVHAYPGENAFPPKLKNFDYTLGDEMRPLSEACGADALLFIRGIDHEATAGRAALFWWNLVLGAATGVTVIPLNPTFVTVGLVDGASGEVEWFIVNPPGSEYSLRNPSHMNHLIEWMTRDFLTKR